MNRFAALLPLACTIGPLISTGCSLTVNHTCHTSEDCLQGQCVAGFCRLIESDSSLPDASDAGTLNGDWNAQDVSSETEESSVSPARKEGGTDAGDDPEGGHGDADQADGWDEGDGWD